MPNGSKGPKISFHTDRPEPMSQCYAMNCNASERMTLIMHGQSAKLSEGWIYRKFTYRGETIIVSVCPAHSSLPDAVLFSAPPPEAYNPKAEASVSDKATEPVAVAEPSPPE